MLLSNIRDQYLATRFLVEKGLDINRVDSYRTAPLLDIVNDMRDYDELLCDFYIENGANPFIENAKGESPASINPRLFKGVQIISINLAENLVYLSMDYAIALTTETPAMVDTIPDGRSCSPEGKVVEVYFARRCQLVKY